MIQIKTIASPFLYLKKNQSWLQPKTFLAYYQESYEGSDPGTAPKIVCHSRAYHRCQNFYKFQLKYLVLQNEYSNIKILKVVFFILRLLKILIKLALKQEWKFCKRNEIFVVTISVVETTKKKHSWIEAKMLNCAKCNVLLLEISVGYLMLSYSWDI